MKTFLVLLSLTVLVTVAVLLVFFQVNETEYVIVKLFGNPWRTIEQPGLAVRWPWPVEQVVRIDKRIKITDIQDTTGGSAPRESEYLTRDKKNVLVNFFVTWRVKDPLRFLISVADVSGAESRLADILRSEMGTELARYDLSDLVCTGKLPAKDSTQGEELTAESMLQVPPPGETKIPVMVENITKRAAKAAWKDFGIEVLGVGLRRLNFPRQNKDAVFQRMEAERERIAVHYRSEGKELSEKLKAEADRLKAELINTAQRKAEEIQGEADAEATRIYAEAYGKDPEFYEFYQTLETLRRIMTGDDIVILPADSPILRFLRNADVETGKAPVVTDPEGQ